MAEVHSQPTTDVLKGLRVASDQGLSDAEVQRRRRLYGWNRLRETRQKSGWIILKNQFERVIGWLLLAASLLSFYLGDWTEGAAIVAVLAINSIIGFSRIAN